MRRLRLSWRNLAFAVGPGMVAMLADTDAGSVITLAQSGAQWGYRLLLPNLLLIPFMFMAQELALRLGLGTRQGAAELVLRHFGRFPAVVLLLALTLSCFGALVSEMSGLAGVAQACGVPVPAAMACVVAGLIVIVVTGSYHSVERIALILGSAELAFLFMAWRASPGFAPIVRQAAQLPLHDRSYLYLLAANLGTSIIPWALLYQQSASVDKGLGPQHITSARIETFAGVVLCQTISCALLIAAGSTFARGVALQSVTEIETAFTATLGVSIGRAVFVLGVSGGALVATIVVCLTLAWTLGEVLGVKHSLEHHPRQAPWFYGSMSVMLGAAGVLVALRIDLVDLTIAAGVLNALLLPLVLAFLYRLARVALPGQLRLQGSYGVIVGVGYLIIAVTCLYAGIAGLLPNPLSALGGGEG
jgi:Mn2+/Fe2+ NRAMP family transporter